VSGSRPVLLLMDFQHGIVESIGLPSVVGAADRAAKAARAAGLHPVPAGDSGVVTAR